MKSANIIFGIIGIVLVLTLILSGCVSNDTNLTSTKLADKNFVKPWDHKDFNSAPRDYNSHHGDYNGPHNRDWNKFLDSNTPLINN